VDRTPGLKHLRETKLVYVTIRTAGRCSDVPLYDSVVDTGFSFPPTLVVVGALMLKRWIVSFIPFHTDRLQ
jgi:hypothetical protein